MPTDTPLPDDIDALKALVLAQRVSMDQMSAALASRALEVEQLKLLIAKLQRMQFGRKSEKIGRQIEKLECRLEDLLADEGVVDAAPPASIPVRKRAASARPVLPPGLPREDHILEPTELACPQCGGNLKPLGEDIAEQLEIVSSAFKVIRHIRRKKACACCDCIVQAAAPSRPILCGVAGPGLLTHILVSKFADHQPLSRQSAIYARQGVDIDRSSMSPAPVRPSCTRWSIPYGGTSWQAPSCMPTTRRYRSWLPVMARRRQVSGGKRSADGVIDLIGDGPSRTNPSAAGCLRTWSSRCAA